MAVATVAILGVLTGRNGGALPAMADCNEPVAVPSVLVGEVAANVLALGGVCTAAAAAVSGDAAVAVAKPVNRPVVS